MPPTIPFGLVPPFQPAPSQEQNLPSLEELIMRAFPQQVPETIPVPDQPRKSQVIVSGIADALGAIARMKGGQAPPQLLPVLTEMMNRRKLIEQENARRTQEAGVATDAQRARAQLDLRRDEIDRKSKSAEKQEARDFEIQQQKQREDFQREMQTRKEDLRKTLATHEESMRLKLAKMEREAKSDEDKVSIRQMAKEQRELLKEAKEGAITVKRELAARLQRGETKEQIRESFIDTLDSMGLDEDAMKAAMAFFEMKVGPLLAPVQGPEPQPQEAPKFSPMGPTL